MSAKPEILAFYGTDRAAAWAKALELAETITENHATWQLSVRAEKQRGEWVVALYREGEPCPRGLRDS